MKYIYYLRLLTCFLFGSVYALSFIIVTLYGRHLLVSPFELTIFPSMALGCLFCSFIPGERYVTSWFKVRYVIFATVVIAIALMSLALVAHQVQFIHYRSTSLIVICAMLGLALGYLKAEYHVRLFQVISSKVGAVLASAAFLLGLFSVYCMFYPMDVAFILVDSTPGYTLLITLALVIIVVLLGLMGIEQYLLSKQTYAMTFYISETDNYHSEQVHLQLGFLTVLAIQIALFWGVAWTFYLQKVYAVEWLHRVEGNLHYALIMMSLGFFAILSAIIFLYLASKRYIFYMVQSLSLAIVLGILVAMSLVGVQSEWLAKISSGVLVALCAILLVVFHYYVILFFKGQLIRAFVPIAIGLSGFLLATIWIITPTLIRYSQFVLGFMVIIALALLFLFILTSFNTFRRLDQLRLSYQRQDSSLPS